MRAALAFLTVLPVGRGVAAPGRGALLAFPLVGVLVGGLWVGAAALGLLGWDPAVAAVAVLVVDAVATGGLHLDAVADVGDVAGSRRRGAAALEVARDPGVGALGATALGVTLLVRFALLAALLAPHAAVPPWDLLAVPVVGRAGLVLALGRWRTRAATPSSADAPARAAGPGVQAAVLATTVALLALVGVGPVRIVVLLAAVGALVAGLARWWRRRVGTGSGDLVGTTGVAAETVALAVLSWGT